MLKNLFEIEPNEIVEKAAELHKKGYRLAAITCEKENGKLEFTYHFDLNYELYNLRFHADVKDKIKSISKIFPAAFLMENEIQDLYGNSFEGLIVDYKGKLYLTENSPKAPMFQSKEE